MASIVLVVGVFAVGLSTLGCPGAFHEPDPTRPTPLMTNLVTSEGELFPAFQSSITRYGISVPLEVTSLNLTPFFEDEFELSISGLSFDGNSVNSGGDIVVSDIPIGESTLQLSLSYKTASSNKNDYAITISRGVGMTSSLIDLSLFVEQQNQAINPSFLPDNYEYSVSVLFATETVDVSATTLESISTITIDAQAVDSGVLTPVALDAITDSSSTTDIDVTVVSNDQNSTSTYTLAVERLPASNNSLLSSLTLSQGPIDPLFNSNLLSYNTNFNYLVKSIAISPTVADVTAEVTVNGMLVSSGTFSQAIELDEGENTIDIRVLAEDDISETIYQVFVYRDLAASFAQQAYVKASNTSDGDQFGYSVSISANTMVVGSVDEDSNAVGINGDQSNNSASNSGAAYVFVRDSDGQWSQQAYLKASNAESNDRFGSAVSLNGNTLAISSREDSGATGVNGVQSDNSEPGSGAVYIFVRNSANVWKQQAYLKASNTLRFNEFGKSVAVSGNTVAIGAYREDSTATGIDGDQQNILAPQSGAVYVFTRDIFNTWSQQAYIKASNTNRFDQFGHSVALDGDTLAVGANQEDSNATGINGDQNNLNADSSGAVYVFTRDGPIWTQQAYIKASNTNQNDEFGFSIALSNNTLAVGARGESSNAIRVNGDQNDNSAIDAGAVYIFVRDNQDVWSQVQYIKASNAESGDQFGSSVALTKDLLAISAVQEDSNAIGINGDHLDNSAENSGATYIFTHDSNNNWAQHGYVKASNTELEDAFGYSVALFGNSLSVGARLEDSNATGLSGDQTDNTEIDSGAVYVFSDLPFNPALYSLVVGKIGNGSGTISGKIQGATENTIDCGSDCNQILEQNTVYTLSAAAEPGSEFTAWSGDPACSSNVLDNVSEVTITSNLNCFAEFSQQATGDVTITVSKAEDQTGDGNVFAMMFDFELIACPSGCTTATSEAVDVNSEIIIFASPNNNSDFIEWSGDASCAANASGSETNVTLDIAKTCTAKFNLKPAN